MPYPVSKIKMDIRLLSLYVQISFKNAFKQFFERNMVKTFDFREKNKNFVVDSYYRSLRFTIVGGNLSLIRKYSRSQEFFNIPGPHVYVCT
jgi:hypothetical protein